ncbi:MAG: bifunctional 4-hydroxy-3-methylbut-2-enyl diphosphate reductase/30S ribosomal protein S1 [Subdoligranulum sp.]|nr:bifunctional 4-hydroxy-3-methylbut-2-enyl diphosphate reductase/30S ribosomal protein S1 [Subdoligranulum sp.]MCI6445120.1 bifunctional 4-hydroxy-3-methylbut-2-enyl diphosphate reductase/30S ribosomal protein S1 [Subdoligranulum sp.]MCI6623751.1 bifunctional 4-hydroxy-3-methylbut-2-enyl diphosphate reductase/30S ribosomal protein S1 [Subdoligranulum sp.]MDD7736614.1 bifunctional 4-hydroxy-3-methylbut-2-enyl diphosphate reductase/30S ribosomal protein S1 [Subdoligranulum sp.]
MQIILAKTAGFCFGVNRAVKLTYELLEQGRPVATLGPLIHNPQVVEDLESKGAITCDSVDDVPDGCEVVIRSHGVGQSVYDKISTRRLAYHDATCPFVTKIHKIAARAGAEGAMLLVAGDAKHPEVQGIVGHTTGKVEVFANLAELEKLLPELTQQKSIFAVAQTTFNVQSWETCKEFLKNQCTNAKIFDTICNATWARQQEAEDLSQKCDHMVVIGGHHSSNTQKLLQVAARHTKAINVETADELDKDWLNGARIVGVTAGASTPSSIIEEVLNCMSEEIRDDMSFEEMLAASEAKPLYAGKIVKAKVISVSPTECVVGIDGSKHTGIVKLSEMSHDPNAKMEDLVKVDDELDLVVVKINDQEGVDTLSRVRFEAQKGMKDVSEAAENGTVMEGDVMEANKGGVVVNVKGVRVFVPRSQATMRRDEDYTKLVGQHVKLVITECAGRKIVGSINKVTAEENKAKRDEFWKNVEVDKQYTGVVKSLTSYGAFVDIGGVDGLCHISELSWNNIKHPSEVVSVGDTIEVYVKSYDPENQKVSLGYKKEEDNPWEKLKNEYPIGSEFEAPVVSITKFGAFVRILPGIDGLVHISEISNERVNKVSDVLKVGDMVKVKLINVDFDRKRISLSMKACLDEAAEDAE